MSTQTRTIEELRAHYRAESHGCVAVADMEEIIKADPMAKFLIRYNMGRVTTSAQNVPFLVEVLNAHPGGTAYVRDVAFVECHSLLR